MSWPWVQLLVLLLQFPAGGSQALVSCPGGCNNDGQITIEDVVVVRNIAAGESEVMACESADHNRDEAVSINELLTAINAALSVCPPPVATPTPTSSRLPTPTPTATVSPTRTPALTSLLESSPANGEDGVAVTRDTVLRFSQSLDPAYFEYGAFRMRFGGQALDFYPHLSSDGRTATLFYSDLPSSARIRVTVDGGLLRDMHGRAVDADSDGAPGGIATIDFDTLTLTSLPGTVVYGRVFASELASAGGEAVSCPLAGAKISVDGKEDTLFTSTDAMGNFRLENVPAGRFFVHVDGREVRGAKLSDKTVETNYPNGYYYPSVGKEWETVAGQAQPACGSDTPGCPGDIYLPLIVPDTLIPVSETEDTSITFPASVLAEFPELTGVTVTVPAKSLLRPGSATGRVGIAPVSPDRLPGPLPPGLNFPLVITVQTDGAQNFDIPAPACFPNLADPTTGLPLPPGAKSALWSFSHQTGQWEVVGPMTVTENGHLVCTDPGTGIRAPGWHGVQPGTSARGGGMAGNSNPNCRKEQQQYGSGLMQCGLAAAETLAETGLNASGFGCPARIGTGIVFTTIDCSLEFTIRKCGASVALGVLDVATSCFPPAALVKAGGTGAVGLYAASATCFLAVEDWTEYTQCIAFPRSNCAPFCRTTSATGNILAEQAALISAASAFYDAVFGRSKLFEVDSSYLPLVQAVMQSLHDVTLSSSDGGSRITPMERAHLSDLPRPVGVAIRDITALADRIDRMIGGELAEGEVDVDAIAETASALSDLSGRLKAQGWVTTLDGFTRGLPELSEDTGVRVGETEILKSPLHYLLADTKTGTIQRGLTGSQGSLGRLVLAPNRLFVIQYLDPRTLNVAVTFFNSSGNGSLTEIPRALLSEPDPTDSDGDGLPDIAERIIRTDPTNPDTDRDGIRDGAEVQQGTNPLDGLAAATGISATADTPGTAIDIVAFNDLAAVADGERGVTVFNVFNGMNPVSIARVDTPGTGQAVALAGNLVAVADGGWGLAVIDITDPPAARIVHQVNLGGAAQAVATAGTLAFVGLASGEVVKVDLPSGAVLDRVAVGGSIQDLSIAADTLYALTVGTLYALPLFEPNLGVSGSVPSPGSIGAGAQRLRLFAGSDIAYAVHTAGYNTFDLTNPRQPALVANGNTSQFGWKQIVPNGSGLGIAAVSPNSTSDGPHDISLYNSSNPTQTNEFLTTFETPGLAAAVSIYNGLAYVADGAAGMQVINYLPYDAQQIPPTITLSASFPLAPALAEEGKLVRVTANVGDDVQVRNVEFHVDGVKVATDGNYPFEFRFNTPLLRTQPRFTLRARASDTGGNTTWSEEIVVDLVPDATPPRITGVSPRNRAILGRIGAAAAFFNEPIAPATVTAASFSLREAGVDANFDTTDDVPILGSVEFRSDVLGAFFSVAGGLRPGRYRGEIDTTITDLAGNPLAGSRAWTFTVFNVADDSDGDCIPDTVEALLGLDAHNPDTNGNGIGDGERDADADGLSNCEEILLSSDALNPDTNGNGTRDGDEDSDGDGIKDGEELRRGIDPQNADSDDDGFGDGDEIKALSDPLDQHSLPIREAYASFSVLNRVDPSTLVGFVAGPSFSVLNAADPSTLVGFAAAPLFSVLNQRDPSTLVGFATAPTFSVLNASDPSTLIGFAAAPLFSVLNQVDPSTESGFAVAPLFSVQNVYDPIQLVTSAIGPLFSVENRGVLPGQPLQRTNGNEQ